MLPQIFWPVSAIRHDHPVSCHSPC